MPAGTHTIAHHRLDGGRKIHRCLVDSGPRNAKDQALELAKMVNMTIDQHIKTASALAADNSIVETLTKVKKLGNTAASEDTMALRHEMASKFDALDENYLGIFVTDSNGLLLTGVHDDGTTQIGAFASVPSKNWSIAFSQNEEELIQDPSVIRFFILKSIFVSLGIVGIVVFFASKALTQPIKLARQTVFATRDIKKVIQDVQETVLSAEVEIGQVSNLIKDVDQIIATISIAVQEQSTATHEITENIAQASLGIQEVNENVTKNSLWSTHISQDIAELSITSRTVLDGSKHLEIGAQEVQSLADELDSIVGHFKLAKAQTVRTAPTRVRQTGPELVYSGSLSSPVFAAS